MKTFLKIKGSLKVILSVGILLIFLVLALYLSFQLRYKYWHFYVHNKLTFFMDDEFRDLLRTYGEKDNFASFEQKGKVGVIVTYPLKGNIKYSIQLRLSKDLEKEIFFFRAEIASPERNGHFNTGNPPIYIEIPLKYFNNVIEKGLSDNQIKELLTTAEDVGWEPTEFSKTYKLKPPVVVEYKD